MFSVSKSLLCAVLVAISCCPLARAQPPQPLPQVAVQTRDGFRLRITRAAWDNLSVGGRRPALLAGKGLTLRYEAERADAPYTGELSRQIVELEASGPHGEPVKINRSGSPGVLLTGVNPHWQKLNLDFSLLEPGADSNEANARSIQLLNFEKVPLPAQAGETAEPNLVLETQYGAKVTLKSVTLKAETARKSVYHFALDLDTPATPGDLKIEPLNAAVSWRAKDARRPLRRGLRGEMQISSPPPHPRRHQRWEYSIDQRLINAQGLLKTIDVELRIRETAPSLKKTEAFHRFHFELPLQEVDDRALTQPIPVIATAHGRGVEIEVEDWGTGWSPQPASSLLRLWAKTVEPHAADWLIGAVRVGDAVVPLAPSPFAPRGSGWRANNKAAAVNEHSVSIFQARSKNTTDKKVLQVELAQASFAAYGLKLQNLPLPKPGKTIETKRTTRDESGAEFSVRAVHSFTDSEADLPAGWPRSGEILPLAPTGLALWCVWKPAGGARTQISLHQLRAQDNAGRSLLDEPLDFSVMVKGGSWDLDEAIKSSVAGIFEPQETYEFTLFLLPPAAAAKSFDLELSSEEIMPTGQKQTIKVELRQER